MSDYIFNKVCKFVIANRGQSTFVDWTKEEIEEELLRHVNKKTLLICGDNVVMNDGKDVAVGMKIYGVIVYDVNDETKTLHINHVITVDKEALKYFLEVYKKYYPTYTIQAFRRGNFIRYSNTAKLVKKLTAKLFYV